ncbi:phage tail tube protein [Clostridium oryzae]|uniref:Phage-like element PBSX protein XkdM n=1 Tax=Clostridium oryzae TaxID=1450648 RepID=A0A1V4IF11_9CLOT|nr:phage tail tube protein [Clostridium oryzae]OPJ58440.1 phage-like element PBSX protein XkdM [Clostridium oryzae]
MNSYNPQNVINGTYGELWVDGNYLAQVTALEAKVTFTKADVNMTRRLMKAQKVTGMEGKGTIKLNKVSSFFINLLSDDMKNGRQNSFTIISKLDDPDALGAERVVLKDCTFDELTLANWEAKKNGEESIPFTFSDWELRDVIGKEGTSTK